MAWRIALRKRCGAGAAAVALLAAGCGDEVVAPAYVGKVTDAGSDAVVGMVSDGTRVELYLCGGPSSYATLTHWFQGPVEADGTFSIMSGDFQVTGDLNAGAGKVLTDQGETLSWSVQPVTGDLPGLYAAMDGSCRTGVVVGDFAGDGTTAVQGTWCDGVGRFAQVTPLTPLALTDRGIAVKVQTSPPRQIYVDRVRAP